MKIAKWRIDYNGRGVWEIRRNGWHLAFVTWYLRVIPVAVAFLLGAMILPAQAAAETAQERAARNGWTITTDDQPVVPMQQVAKSCPNARAKRAGSAIRNWNDQIMVFGRIALKVGARNGRIILCGRGQAYGSPGRGWSAIYGPWMEVRRPCCHGRHLRWRFEMKWMWASQTVDQIWALRPLEIGAHVRKGTNQIWFDVRRVWV